ncbi:Retrovirus-related Pol polyprotein from transposon RE2 [Vitis vinifera]|uniref:Retrovirus-related Pol polyprotein from transposon RE2 n=1 Tax=Vitis vinifera TaxID=29760 RepID=A0A438HI70_VITVI|nr:Retrovirus-related Pol polyprotein from transposon RE2 [Vitis vinifera]
MALGQKVALEDSAPFPDVTLYHSTICALQYLTLTRPDISFSVNKLSQFLKAPTQHYWSACKCLLRYVSGTPLLVYLSDLLLDLHLKASRMRIGLVMLMTEDLQPVIVFFLVAI